MKGGQRRPQAALRSRRSGKRLAKLWPSEDSIDDRVTNQVTIRIFLKIENYILISYSLQHCTRSQF